jgi:serpin B
LIHKQTAPFHLSPDKTADVEMMHGWRDGEAADLADAKLFELHYESGDLSMIILLPNKIDGLSALEQSLTADSFEKSFREAHEGEAHISLPKTTMRCNLELSGTLSAMGMPTAFSRASPTLAGLGGSKEDLFLSNVLHQAFLSLDETGTEIAAATTETSTTTSAPAFGETIEFNADHPFVFLIRDNRSGAILFIGRYMGPP